MAEFVESIRYEADISDLKDKLKRIEGSHGDVQSKTSSTTARMRESWGKVSSKIGGTIKTLGKFTAAFTVAGIGAAAALAPKILEQGTALDSLGKKAKTVFGGSLGDVEGWAKDSAKAMGLTRSQLIGMTADTADLLKPMGFAEDQAAAMAMKTNDLSGALSAWSNGTVSAEEASKILTKAYLGERDALTSLGIKISEADVSSRLAEKGQDKLTGAALEQAKAIATQELVFEKSTDAQKAWTDGSMDAVKAQNKSKASVAQLKEGLVRALYPAIAAATPHFARMASWLGDKLPGAIATVTAWFERNWPKIQATIAQVVDWLKSEAWPVIQTVMAAIVNAGTVLVAWVQENWPKIQATIASMVAWFETNAWPVIQSIVAFIQAEFESLVGWVRENWPEIRETIAGVIEAVRVIIEKVTAVIKVIWERWGDQILAFLEARWNTIKAVIEAALKIIRGVIDTVTSLIRGDWEGVWNGIKTIFSGVWDAIKAIVSGAIAEVKIIVSTVWGEVKGIFESIWNGIKGFFSGIWTDMKGLASDGVSAVIGSIAGLPAGIANAAAGAFDSIWNGFRAVINRVVDAWNSLRLPGFTVGGWDPPGPGSFPSITIPSVGTPYIPRLASGNVATGPMLGLFGEYPGARQNPEITSPVKLMAETLRAELANAAHNQPSPVGSQPLTLRVGQYEFDAYLERRDDELAGAR